MIAARAARELGRVPVPRIATAVFQRYLQPRLGAFTHARYGVGRPRLADLSRCAVDLHRHRQGRVLMLGRRAPSLLLRADYHGVPVFAAAAYPIAALRDEAIAEIGQLGGEPEQPVRMRLVCAYPLPRVPCRRYLRAYERLTGTAIGSPVGMLAPTRRLDSAIPVSTWAQTQAAVFAFARQAASPEERLAYDLDEPVGVIYAAQPRCLIVQVYNSSGTQQVKVSPAENFAGPFFRFQVAHTAALGTDQRLGRITYSPGPGLHEDPAITTLLQISVQAAAFNQHQDLLAIDAGQAALQDALTEAAEREAADARVLAAVLPAGDAIREITDRTTYILLRADKQHQRRLAGHDLAATWSYIDNDHGADQKVRVAIQQPADHENQPGDRLARLQHAFGMEPEELNAIAWHESDATLTIAGMLGFTIADIQLQHH